MKVVVNTKGAEKKLSRAEKKANEQVKRYVWNLANVGKIHALSMAPFRTGALASHIIATIHKGGFRATITSQNTIGMGLYGDVGRDPGSFSLPRYFDYYGNPSRSGVPRYMTATLNMLKAETRGKGVKLKLE